MTEHEIPPAESDQKSDHNRKKEINSEDSREQSKVPSAPIQFFDSNFAPPKSREDVKINEIGFFVYDDRRRVAVGFDIIPFLEGPSIEVTILNDNGELAGSLTVIETNQTNFSLIMHLRDENPTDIYHVTVTLYYATPDTDRVDVDTHAAIFDVTKSGEQLSGSRNQRSSTGSDLGSSIMLRKY